MGHIKQLARIDQFSVKLTRAGILGAYITTRGKEVESINGNKR